MNLKKWITKKNFSRTFKIKANFKINLYLVKMSYLKENIISTVFIA